MSTGTTGHVCQQGGIYKCSQHPSNEIPIAKGNVFPPCSRDGGHGATWILVRPDK